MEAEQSFKKAGERLRNAIYLLGQFPILREAKLLASAAKSVFEAADAEMTAVLLREKELKRMPLFPENFEVKLDIFKNWAAKRNLSQKHSEFLREMKEAMSQTRNYSPEFVKKAISAGKAFAEDVSSSLKGETNDA